MTENIKQAERKKSSDTTYISPYEAHHSGYSALGYSTLPIMFAGKRPGVVSKGAWTGLNDWKQYATRFATEAQRLSWARMRDSAGHGCNIGLAMGTPAGQAPDGGKCVVVALDFDPADDCPNEAEIMQAMTGFLPGAWGKIGKRGGTLLARMPVAELPRGFDFAGPGGKLQIIRDGQTVVPGSLHPDTGKPYSRWEGTADLGICNKLPLLALADLDAMMGQFGYKRGVLVSTAAEIAIEDTVRENIALGYSRADLIPLLDGAPGKLGALWCLGSEAPFMLLPTKGGKARDDSGSYRRVELARQMAAAGYNATEFDDAVRAWDHAEGRFAVVDRDILRAWVSGGLSTLATMKKAAGASNFSAVDDLDTPEAKAVLDPAMAAYALKYPKVIEGKEVRIARRHTMPDGTIEIDLIAPAKFRDFVPGDWVDVPTGAGGTKRVHMADLYMKADVPLLRGQRFMPGLEQSECGGSLNTWTGWGVKPSEEGSCEAFKRHLLGSVCSGNAEHYGYLGNWMAHMFQKPRQKPGVAVVIQGGKGCGKTLVGETLGKLIGQKHFLMVKDREHILGRFNASQADALMIQMEEAIWARDPKGEGILKSLITERMMQVERKGIDTFTAPSSARILMTSNEVLVVPATQDERRFLVLKMENGNIVGPVVETIMGELRDGGYARLMFELLATDLTGFNPVKPPATEALAEQVRQNRSIIEDWWADELDDGAMWRPESLGADVPELRPDGTLLIRAGVLKARFDKWRSAGGLRGMSPATWGLGLKKLGMVKLTKNSGAFWIIPPQAGMLSETEGAAIKHPFVCAED